MILENIDNSVYNYFLSLSLDTTKKIDAYLVELFWTSKNKLNFNYFRNKWINSHKEIFQYLEKRYDDSESVYETLYRLKYNVEIRPVCTICGGYVHFVKGHGYSKHCSEKCSANDPLTRKKHDNTCIEKYGVTSYAKTEQCKEQIKLTSLEKYGVEHPTKRDEYKNEIKQKSLALWGTSSFFETDEFKEKSRNTCRKKYGKEFICQTDIFKEKSKNTCKEKYGSEYYLNSVDCKEKTITAQSSKKGYYGSKGETKLFNILNKVYPNIKREYISEKYPFHCDFYIPELDLFIEFNGMWVHNNHAFSNESEEDLNTLEEWKEKAKTSLYYKRAINIWTFEDVKKREYAKEHNLNWIEGWTINEILDKLHLVNKDKTDLI